MKFTSNKKFAAAAATAFLGLGAFAPGAMAADHRDSLAVDAIPEGDFTDVFAYVDPANNSNVILSMTVNPFTNPSEGPSVRFGDDLLYAFKINNSMANGVVEDQVVQIQFSAGRGTQTYQAYLAPASLAGTGSVTHRVPTTGAGVTALCTPVGVAGAAAPVYLGQVNTTTGRGVTEAAAKVNTTIGGQCFAGLRDDSFQTDVGQAVFRIGLNSNTGENLPAHDQDLFRGYGGAASILGGLRGQGLRLDGSSGVDGFGGYDSTVIAISIPKSLLRGTGIPDVSQVSAAAPAGAINSSLIGVWGTVSRPTGETFDGFTSAETTSDFAQFERMGQQLFNTVFVFAQPIVNSPFVAGTVTAAGTNVPGITNFNGVSGSTFDTNTNQHEPRLTASGIRQLCPSGPASLSGTSALSAAVMKDIANAVSAECDFALWDRFFPDSLTVAGNGPATPGGGGLLGGLLGGVTGLLFPAGSSGSRNTVGNRATLLTVLGFNSAALTGVPLYSGAASLQGNTNSRLQAQLSIPDYMRLNLDTATDGIRPGAATSGNTSATLALSKWGLQNGRRPADDVTDIVLRITREVADVKFGDNLVLPGVGAGLPGGGPLGSRRPVNCNLLTLGGGAGLLGALSNVTGGITGLVGALLRNPGNTLSDLLAGQYTISVLTPCEESRVFAVLQGTDWIKTSPLDLISVANQTEKEGPLQDSFPYFGIDPVPGEPGTHDFPSQTSSQSPL